MSGTPRLVVALELPAYDSVGYNATWESTVRPATRSEILAAIRQEMDWQDYNDPILVAALDQYLRLSWAHDGIGPLVEDVKGMSDFEEAVSIVRAFFDAAQQGR